MQTAQINSLKNQHTVTSAELERYKMLVDSVQDYAIFLLDKDGYIQTWNKGAEKNKGYKPHEIIGKHFSNFYLQHDIDAKKPERELRLAAQLGRVEDEDWRVRKDGTQFWANVVITALFDDDDVLVGYAKVTRDLTERKHQEDALRTANHLLKQRQHELEQLNLSKDEFISLASHQLRTPATAIKQLLGMLLEGFRGDLPPDLSPIIKKAYESNERQIDIVNSLLKVAQIDAGKLILQAAPVDLRRMLREIAEQQSDTAIARRQKIDVVVPKSIADLHLDGAHFRMALENLVDNASKYTPAEGTIELSASQTADEVIISIKDNGVGIAPEDIDKLFTKFGRIPNELSDSVGGSGLGLYWAERVIRLHGGRIAVESKPSEGTVFYIHLPKGSADA